MRVLWFCLPVVVAGATGLLSPRANEAHKVPALLHAAVERPALDRSDAFVTAYEASFYQFDSCGDGLGGRLFRRALEARFAHCASSEAAEGQFRARLIAQRRTSSQMTAGLIDRSGGLPAWLDGMDRTDREQMENAEDRAVRSRLDDFSAGKATPDTVVDVACDAAEIAP